MFTKKNHFKLANKFTYLYHIQILQHFFTSTIKKVYKYLQIKLLYKNTHKLIFHNYIIFRPVYGVLSMIETIALSKADYALIGRRLAQ